MAKYFDLTMRVRSDDESVEPADLMMNVRLDVNAWEQFEVLNAGCILAERRVIICHDDFVHLIGLPDDPGNLGCWHWSTRNDPEDARVLDESVALRIIAEHDDLPSGSYLRDALTLAVV